MKNRRSLCLLKTFAFLLGVAISFHGCSDDGPKRYKVSGTVTANGQIVDQGTISLEPVGGGASSGGVVIDGKFECESIPGEMIVVVTGSRLIPGAPKVEVLPGEFVDAREDIVAPKYHSSSSDLRVTVEASNDESANVFEIKADK